MKVNPFHCCATCIHITASKQLNARKTSYFCSRLGYETRTDYRFSCWEPKEAVKDLMKKRGIS
ncbi:hypothetical protein AS034_03925 [[Bacillus] enclensis]|uniref:Uncharacterized protein n=1 Tax=Rossellomorea oryzaecorticis TaxID=1396505 RepID=A0ABW8VRZ3_9BACI|nr:hypothetical protein [[Bacillus] enclensis]OAT83967.1 hypothetical protein A6P54_01320 [Bacillus sp. MKU004]QTC43261.1 hypothetical protein I7V34_08510 [Bacillus sp. V3]QWC21428.1 hypothetical protein KJK41_13955 [Bacillus haikouensis]KSU63409.1 hypothetical protein AS034_03925 [[Bacillus] enclensis]MBH9967695.1 hypothetical protein [[Bacillus] enclensis]